MSCPFTHKPRWARRKDARPQELLAAALDLFVERGFAATRLDDVAAQAGVSKGTLYLYFTNKEDLFKAVVRNTVVPIIGEAEDMAGRFEGNSTELLRMIMYSWWERIGATKLSGITKLMMAESSNFPEVARFYHDEVIERANGMLYRAISRGIESGEFRKVDVQQATQVLVAPMLMLMMWKHSFNVCHIEPVDIPSYLACYIDLMLNGLSTSQ
jgi:AcrR family transcriptional regulator